MVLSAFEIFTLTPTGKIDEYIHMSSMQEILLAGHEQVVFCNDPSAKLRAIVAIHSTALGPSLGGTRFYPYSSEGQALTDVLRLSRAMTYKAAGAGLALGGGKCVIMADPATDKSEALFLSYGRFIESLSGRYITAEDVGTTVADIELVRRETRWTTGVSKELGGSGDPSPATASGLHTAYATLATELWGKPTLQGRTVAVQGLGKVGYDLARRLTSAGANLIVADVDRERASAASREFRAQILDPETIHSAECDIFAPCALGAVLNETTIPELKCSAVAGAANNQLYEARDADRLLERNILWAPDFIVNAGGIINLADELNPLGYDERRAYNRIDKLGQTLRGVLIAARENNVSTLTAAERLAEQRLNAAAGGPLYLAK